MESRSVPPVTGTSAFEMVPLYTHRCQKLRCLNIWRSLKARPGVCPECKSPTWDRPPKRPMRNTEVAP